MKTKNIKAGDRISCKLGGNEVINFEYVPFALGVAQPLEMTFEPKEDITAYELAMCLRMVGQRFYTVDMEPTWMRHWIVVDPNKK